MAIETKGADGAEAPRPTAQAHATTHTSAPTGGSDFLSFTSALGINRINSAIEPYLTTLMKAVKSKLPGAELVPLTEVNDSFVVKYDGADGRLNFIGILFVSLANTSSPNMAPESMKLRGITEELKKRYPTQAYRLIDNRVIIAGYQPDMDRAEIMADTIVRSFQVASDPVVRNANVEFLKSNEFVADWNLYAAKDLENRLSPHGVRPRMEIALTLKAKIKRQFSGNDFGGLNDEYVPLGVIGGYTEFREKEAFVIGNVPQLRYQPIFHITTVSSIVPLEGVGGILLAALAPTIYNTKFWLKQWQDLSKDAPNPGHLEEDENNRGQPVVLKDQEQLLAFAEARFVTPVISYQVQDGRDGIPGLWRLNSANSADQKSLIDRMTQFFNAEQVGAFSPSVVIEHRSDGAVGQPDGVLSDSRNVDFLSISATNGWSSIDREARRILLASSDNATERAKLVQLATGSFYPLWLTTIALINPDFFRWLVQLTDRARLQIIDPNGNAEIRPIGQYTASFGSSSGISSIIGTAATKGGLNLQSWNNFR